MIPFIMIVQKILAFVKSYWKIFLIAIGVVCVCSVLWFCLNGHLEAGFQKKLDTQKVFYETEITNIEQTYKDELASKSKLEVQYQTAIADLEKNYEEKQQQLNETQKKRVKIILKENMDNPERRERLLAMEFGLQIVKP